MEIYSVKDCLFKIAYRNKYDIKANELVRNILSHVKDSQSYFSVNIEEFSAKLEVFIERINKDKIEETKGFTSVFEAKGKTEAKLVDGKLVETKIIINLQISNSFCDKDYESFNYSLYEIIRHELEHCDKYIHGKVPDLSYKNLYDKIFSDKNRTLKEHIELISQYITDPNEIDSYARSIVYVAKKQKKEIDSVILQVFNRAFFNNNRENALLAQKDISINKMVEDTKSLLKKKIRELYPRITFREIFI